MAGQQHLDRLSAIDAGFLAQEKLLGDYDALPDLDVVAEVIEGVAGATRGAGGGGRLARLD